MSYVREDCACSVHSHNVFLIMKTNRMFSGKDWATSSTPVYDLRISVTIVVTLKEVTNEDMFILSAFDPW
jgi:hypothetical protein